MATVRREKSRQPRARLWRWAAVIAAISAGSSASASPPIDYAAPANCPDAVAFEAAVSRRLNWGKVEVPSRPDRRFVVQIQDKDGVIRGVLWLDHSEQGEPVRQLEGVSCPEVVRALAFVVAVLIDPNAAMQSPNVEPAAQPLPTFAPVPRHAPTADRKAARPSWSFGLGTEMAIQSAMAPAAVLAARYGVILTRADPSGAVMGSARISIVHASTGVLAGTYGDASFSATAGRLEGCSPRFGRDLGLEACAWMDAGSLRGRGERTSQTSSRSLAWLAPGVLARAAWRPFSPLYIEVSAGAFAPLIRPRYYFAGPDGSELEMVHEVPKLGAMSGLGVSAIF